MDVEVTVTLASAETDNDKDNIENFYRLRKYHKETLSLSVIFITVNYVENILKTIERIEE